MEYFKNSLHRNLFSYIGEQNMMNSLNKKMLLLSNTEILNSNKLKLHEYYLHLNFKLEHLNFQ